VAVGAEIAAKKDICQTGDRSARSAGFRDSPLAVELVVFDEKDGAE
jgi:hypothetical protein